MTPSLSALREQIGHLILEPAAATEARPIWLTASDPDKLDGADMPERMRDWLRMIGWKARAGHTALVPGEDDMVGAVVGLGREKNAPLRALTPGFDDDEIVSLIERLAQERNAVEMRRKPDVRNWMPRLPASRNCSGSLPISGAKTTIFPDRCSSRAQGAMPL